MQLPIFCFQRHTRVRRGGGAGGGVGRRGPRAPRTVGQIALFSFCLGVKFYGEVLVPCDSIPHLLPAGSINRGSRKAHTFKREQTGKQSERETYARLDTEKQAHPSPPTSGTTPTSDRGQKSKHLETRKSKQKDRNKHIKTKKSKQKNRNKKIEYNNSTSTRRGHHPKQDKKENTQRKCCGENKHLGERTQAYGPDQTDPSRPGGPTTLTTPIIRENECSSRQPTQFHSATRLVATGCATITGRVATSRTPLGGSHNIMPRNS